MEARKLYLGIDVGTQGTRVIIADQDGRVVTETSQEFHPFSKPTALPEGWFQQSPDFWWEATRAALAQSIANLSFLGYRAADIDALSATSTSGTVLAIDRDYHPLRDAIMYNDSRAAAEAETIQAGAADLTRKLGYRFNASFGLPKMLWLVRNAPEVSSQTYKFIHAGDYILGKICGYFETTDYTNALKSGYDVADFRWPEFIETELGIPLEKLPRVLPPGEIIQPVSKTCAAETGLAATTRVVLGMTDGCASQVASGAVRPGTWNTTIGTTLVIKGVTERLLTDPGGSIYCHRHPEGYWMPGGASNVGGDCLEIHFRREEFASLNKQIAGNGPSGILVYPLQKTEERYPIRKTGITGFIVGEARNRAELYQGYLEGVGLVERLAYDLITRMGGRLGERVYVAGGAAKSLEWLKIRAAILNKILFKPKIVGAHMGAAILAASKTYYTSLGEAASRMVKPELEVHPETDRLEPYQAKYEQFLAELKRRGYLEELC